MTSLLTRAEPAGSPLRPAELPTARQELGTDEASRFCPRDQMGLSPQCGFSSAIGTYPLDEAQQERKQRLVAERVWSR